ncbi:DIS3 mitotic control [Desmophyllum pertusum]|uniref:DIS3 mitotic control n=1 Tax=Desmophyllum pertusum TaxID=174260 RepID=A0A9X0D865_9CNID|nr:DIS3 mitotic control [Desmophyllum pertusum]
MLINASLFVGLTRAYLQVPLELEVASSSITKENSTSQTLCIAQPLKDFLLDTSSNKSLADSLDECVDPQDPNFNKVHRLLMAAVEKDNIAQLSNNKELQETCHHINIKHRAAQNAQKESVDLFQSLFFQDLHEDDERRNCDAVISVSGRMAFSCCSTVNLAIDKLIFAMYKITFKTEEPQNSNLLSYGLKGPVYLKDKTGQVVTPHVKEDSVFFGPGMLSRHDYHMTVRNAVGSFDFRLFDHIQVRISVAKSRAHAQALKLELMCLDTRQSPPLSEVTSQDDVSHKMKRSELVKEVKSSREEQDKSVGTQGLDGDFAKLKSEFGQTHDSVSFYCLMEFFREMSLRDDDG